MFFKNKLLKIIVIFLIMFMITLTIILPEIALQGAKKGLIICGNVIIPSLFPFMVCVLMLMKLNFVPKITLISRIFRHTDDMFYVMILSMLGGYPVGARLIEELYNNNKIDKKTAHLMQMYCVNAGPAFITIAVGCGVFSSKKIGYVLLISHLAASFLIALALSKFTHRNTELINTSKLQNLTLAENFVVSTSEAAASVIGICTYVILFSFINSYLVCFSTDLPILKYVVYLTEVTTSVTITKNIILVSFLLGFSGISIWCQIIGFSKNSGVNYPLFIVGRLAHGLISSALTFFLIKIFDVSKTTVSNGIMGEKHLFVSNVSLSISLTVMVILFIIFIYSKKDSRNVLKDMV